MKKLFLGLLFTGLSLFAADGRALIAKCAACHGANFEKAALGKSAIVYGQSASDIYASLIGYKQGTRNTAGMGALMKGQVAAMSNNDMWAVAEYIASLSNQAAPVAETNDWPYACEQPDIKQFAADRYFVVSNSSIYPLVLADAKTISIDRNTKTIKIWTIWLASNAARNKIINALGQYNDYSNYGYSRYLYLINYQNMKVKTLANSHIACEGNVIRGYDGQNVWDNIEPDSVMEEIIESIMKKYNLK